MRRSKAGLRLHQVLLQVKDVQRSRDFYTRKVGFHLLYDFSPEYVAVYHPEQASDRLTPVSKGESSTWDWGTNCRDRVWSR